MKTAIEIFRKHGAHYYNDEEQSVIDAMAEFTKMHVEAALKAASEGHTTPESILRAYPLDLIN